MPLNDFFGHKIHAKYAGWPERLCRIAHIMAKHEGKPFNGKLREQLLSDLGTISPRISADRQGASYRDEITAYQGYLGVYRFRQSPDNPRQWRIEMTKTARRFLLGEAPDVAAFLRLQLPLLQYPNGMGVDHKSGRLQANAKNKTWGFVKQGIKVSPVRLFALALLADAGLRGVEIAEARVSADELYTLANYKKINRIFSPPFQAVKDALRAIRERRMATVRHGEKRFNFLDYTQVFRAVKGGIALRHVSGKADAQILEHHLKAMARVSVRFDGFSRCRNSGELEDLICSDEWGDYFDAATHYSEETTRILSTDAAILLPPNEASKKMAELRRFDAQTRPYTPVPGQAGSGVVADPEVTQIKKERRNIEHSLMVARLLAWLEDRAEAKEVGDSVHIDLWAKLPDGRAFIFEVKSGGEGIMEQVRKGVSQLHEYRYRYLEKFPNAHICLVLPNPPPVKWVPHYLCKDRHINLCLLPIDECPQFHDLCPEAIKVSGTG